MREQFLELSDDFPGISVKGDWLHWGYPGSHLDSLLHFDKSVIAFVHSDPRKDFIVNNPEDSAHHPLVYRRVYVEQLSDAAEGGSIFDCVVGVLRVSGVRVYSVDGTANPSLSPEEWMQYYRTEAEFAALDELDF